MAAGDASRGWRRRPVVHFLVLGALLLAVRGAMAPPPESQGGDPADPVVVSALRLAELRRAYFEQVGADPSPEEDARLVDEAVEEALLVRRARELGLDRDDRGVRTWLAQKMRFLEQGMSSELAPDEDLYRRALELGLDRDDLVVRRMLAEKMRTVASQPPAREQLSETELADFLARNADRYRQPGRVSLFHVFVSGSRGAGSPAEVRVAALLERLGQESRGPEEGVQLGDPFALGRQWRAKSQHELAKLLGISFAEAAFACPTRSWCGPVRSPYGLHLVWIVDREEARPSRLDEVRSQVAEARRSELREERLQDFLQALRERYAVVVEHPAGGVASTTLSGG